MNTVYGTAGLEAKREFDKVDLIEIEKNVSSLALRDYDFVQAKEWKPHTDYLKCDIIEYKGKRYIANENFTSGDEFMVTNLSPTSSTLHKESKEEHGYWQIVNSKHPAGWFHVCYVDKPCPVRLDSPYKMNYFATKEQAKELCDKFNLMLQKCEPLGIGQEFLLTDGKIARVVGMEDKKVYHDPYSYTVEGFYDVLTRDGERKWIKKTSVRRDITLTIRQMDDTEKVLSARSD